MKLVINKDRSVISVGTWGTVNENDYEILDFEFPAELEEYNKRIVYYLGDERVWDTIVNNKAYITNAITTKGDVKAYVWCTKENTEREADTDFRTQLFEMNFYENENADGIVPTEEQVDGFNTMLTAMNEKIEEIDELETTIENAETQRQENEETRQNNEDTRQENEQTRQEQEAERERRTDEAIGEIEDLTEAYNQNAQQKTEAFNNNATQKTGAFNSNAESKTSTFNTNATNKTNDFNSNASSKTTAFNENDTSKTNTFNSNVNDKTSAFNDNATQKTTNFDNNASSKTTTFNENATSKTNYFNDNATEKTTAFNENAQDKIDEYDEHIADYQAQIDELQEEVEELSENMPWNTTEQATEIQVTDAAKYSRNKLELFGNTYQLSLPSGYTHLEYIESTGTQYINLDYVIKSNTKLEIEYQTEKVGGNTLFGASNNNMNYYASGLGGNTAHTGQDNPTNIKVSTDLSTEKTSLLWERAQVTYNGNVVTGNFGLDNSRLVLFHNQRWPNDFGKVKLYKFIAYDRDIIAANYIPCKNGNNEVGLYDVVSNTFYGNSGAGDLVAGTDLGTMPSPDYPQPIHVVTGNNSVGVQGKNLFSGVIYSANKVIQNSGGLSNNSNNNVYQTPVKPNETYTMSITSTDGQYQRDCRIVAYDSEGNYIRSITTFNIPALQKAKKTFTTPDNTGLIRYHVQKLSKEPQLEQGSTATDYAPYYHADYPINLGSIELCKIGNYQDYLYKENGNWYKKNILNKYVFSGNENISKATDVFYTNDIANNILTSGIICLCNRMKAVVNTTIGSSVPVNCCCFRPGDYSRFYFNLSSITTDINEIKQYLSNNNTFVIYPLATPTTTQITDETLIAQLDAIYEHLQLVKGTNNITVTAEDLAPYMELSYMQDIKSKLDNLDSRLALLE